MKFYAAGNFMYFAKLHRERKFWNEARKRYGKNFMRLTSFYFRKPNETVITIHNELDRDKNDKNRKSETNKIKRC